jgi:hypothetical protein
VSSGNKFENIFFEQFAGSWHHPAPALEGRRTTFGKKHVNRKYFGQYWQFLSNNDRHPII